MMFLRYAVVVLILCFFSAVPETAFSQTGSEIMVEVANPEDQPISGVNVQISDNKQILKTDAAGAAVVRDLREGQHLLRLFAPGYFTIDTMVSVLPSQRRHYYFTMTRLAATLAEVTIETDLTGGQRIITREQIERLGARTLPELLRREANINLHSDGTASGEESVTIGGSNANQVLILIDGRRHGSSASGTGDLSAIPVEWIESIKLYRGGRTELGNEAIGGIIDIRTRIPGEQERVRAGVDVYPSYQVAIFSREGELGGLNSFLSYSRTQGPGDYHYTITEDDGNDEFTNGLGESFRRQNSDVLRDRFFGKLTYGDSPGSFWEFSGQAEHAERGMPGYLAPRLTLNARQTSGLSALALRHERDALSGHWVFQSAQTQRNRHFTDPDPYSFVHETREAETQTEAGLQGSYRKYKATVRVGGDYSREEMESSAITGGKARRQRWAAWSTLSRPLLKIKPNCKISAQGGIRSERFGRQSPPLLPRFDLSIEIDGRMNAVMTAGWGKSYRAPAFYSLFWQDDQVSRGNPDLSPELSEEWSGVLSLKTRSMNVSEFRATASAQRIEGLIYWERTFDGHWKPFNLREANIHTLSLEAKQLLFHELLEIRSSVVWTEARDRSGERNTDGKYLTFRPARTHDAGVTFGWRSLRFSADYRWVAARPVLATNSKWLSAYEIVNVSFSGRIPWGSLEFRPQLQLRNILDENFRLIRHAPMPQREIVGSLHLTYNIIR